ncbi:hypothetical protein ACFLSJ_07750, partial [Verrucomicrobiota bacterium]
WPWLNRIAEDHAFEVVLPVSLACACVVLWLVPRAKRTAEGTRLRLFLAIPAGGLAFCLLTAPDPRFAGSAFWVLAVGAMTGLVMSLERTSALWLAGAFSVVVFFQNVNPIAFFHTWNDPGPARTVEMKTMTTESGLEVLVPIEGDQSWDAALPSTPYFRPDLALRVEGDLSRGFRRAKAGDKERTQGNSARGG